MVKGKRLGRHPSNALDVKKVAALRRRGIPGRYFDGGGLHLLIKPSGSASWVLRTTSGVRRRDFGLGGADTVSLADAREQARQFRATIRKGGDPLDLRRSSVPVPTFEVVARAVHAEHRASWRNSKHAAQWITTLETYAFPMIGKIRVDTIGVPEVLNVLAGIWIKKPATARKLRQRMKVVFDYSRASGYRDTENPIGTTLAKALPKQTEPVRHHRALAYARVPEFYEFLHNNAKGGDVTRLALRFIILTCSRSGEARKAKRGEFDLERGIWTVPAERMKGKREHRVPLSAEAVSVLRRAVELSADSEFVFAGAKRGSPLSDSTLSKLMRVAQVGGVPHGFRSSFRDWAGERTRFPREVAEKALAHTVGSTVERAYARSDLFEQRRQLMEAWTGFVLSSPAKVINLRPVSNVTK